MLPVKEQRYIERDVSGHLRCLMQEFPVVTISGPRQSGKTTLARHMYPEYDYVSLENLDERERFRQDPRQFLRQHAAPCIFDEVQHTPELLSYLQGVVDSTDSPGMYILTGSRQMEVQALVTQSLAGRSAMVDLLPLSLHELRRAGIELSRDEYMVKGGLPRVHADGVSFTHAYASYFRTYVERDVRQILNIRNLDAFVLFLRLLAARVGQEVNLSSLAGEVGVSSTTLREWLSVLSASYILFTLQPYYQNLGKRLTKSPKIYFTEPGLVAHLLGIETASQMGRDPLLGNVFENLVVVEALKACFNSGRTPNLYFFRDTRGNEVDLLLDNRRIPCPVEIKSTTTYSPSLCRGLHQFCKRVSVASAPQLVYGGQSLGLVQDVHVRSYLDVFDLIDT